MALIKCSANLQSFKASLNSFRLSSTSFLWSLRLLSQAPKCWSFVFFRSSLDMISLAAPLPPNHDRRLLVNKRWFFLDFFSSKFLLARPALMFCASFSLVSFSLSGRRMANCGPKSVHGLAIIVWSPTFCLKKRWTNFMPKLATRECVKYFILGLSRRILFLNSILFYSL